MFPTLEDETSNDQLSFENLKEILRSLCRKLLYTDPQTWMSDMYL